MIRSRERAKQVQQRREAAGKQGIAKAVRRFMKRNGLKAL